MLHGKNLLFLPPEAFKIGYLKVDKDPEWQIFCTYAEFHHGCW